MNESGSVLFPDEIDKLHNKEIMMMNRNKAEELRAQYLVGLIKRAGASIANSVRTAPGHFMHWYKRHTAVRQLQTLDNRTLQDIGVCRGDIYTVADKAHSGSGKRHY